MYGKAWFFDINGWLFNMLCSCSAWKTALRCSGVISNSHPRIQKFERLLSEESGYKAHS